MIRNLKKILPALIFICSVCVAQASGTDSTVLKKLNESVLAIKKQYSPDKRTAIFNVTIDTSNVLKIRLESTNSESFRTFRSMLANQGISAQVTEELLPSKDLNGRVYGIAHLSVCNTRVLPDHTSEMATQILLGTPVELLKKQRGYYLVRTPDNYISWTEEIGVTTMDKAQYDAWKDAEKIVFVSQFGQVFREASIKSPVISDVVAGNIFKLLGKHKEFFKVEYPDGRSGFIPKDNMMSYSKWTARPNPNADQLINTAMTMMGLPYLWGGTSTKGVDCSGFTKTSYYLNGIVLQRDASQQALYGERVDIYESDTVNVDKCLQNLRKGDLLFFSSAKKGQANGRVSHTAIYIGDGLFIQSAGLVRINSIVPSSDIFDKAHENLVSARRVLNSIGQTGITRLDQHSFYK